MIVREICVAGACIDVEVKASHRQKTSGISRQPRKNITLAEVVKYNDYMAAKKLRRDLNRNFISGDWHLVLTYRFAPTIEQAKKDRIKFQRKYLAECKKLGVIGKYVAVTEWENCSRIHHHIVCTWIAFEIIQRIWPHGQVRPSKLYGKNYKKLADYLIKETTKTFRKPESAFKRRYTCSRSIVRPDVKKEIVSKHELRKDPEPLKGYTIDEDTVLRYENKITGFEHLEYTMISISEKPRLKRWYRGSKVKRYENYNDLLMCEGEQVQISKEEACKTLDAE